MGSFQNMELVQKQNVRKDPYLNHRISNRCKKKQSRVIVLYFTGTFLYPKIYKKKIKINKILTCFCTSKFLKLISQDYKKNYTHLKLYEYIQNKHWTTNFFTFSYVFTFLLGRAYVSAPTARLTRLRQTSTVLISGE